MILPDYLYFMLKVKTDNIAPSSKVLSVHTWLDPNKQNITNTHELNNNTDTDPNDTQVAS